MNKKKRGFTLPEIMIALSVVALLIAIAVPSFQSNRRRALDRVCQNNLSIIQKALQEYMIIEGMSATDDASTIYSGAIVGANDAYIEIEPLTPIGNSSYTIDTFGVEPVCPNRAASPTNPNFINHILQ